MNNHWCSYDSTDPVRVWELTAPLPSSSPDAQRAFVLAAARAADDAGVAIAVGGVDAVVGARPEFLPFEDALFDGRPVPFFARVTVRDPNGALHERESADAGALLRELEPKLDDAYLRRFAAPHPFCGVFSTSTATTVRVTFCFFTSLPFDARDPALLEANQRPLAQLREALVALARKHGARLDAPLARP